MYNVLSRSPCWFVIRQTKVRLQSVCAGAGAHTHTLAPICTQALAGPTRWPVSARIHVHRCACAVLMWHNACVRALHAHRHPGHSHTPCARAHTHTHTHTHTDTHTHTHTHTHACRCGRTHARLGAGACMHALTHAQAGGS
jgi:hypothetical protein